MVTLQPPVGGHPELPTAADRTFKDVLTTHAASLTRASPFVLTLPDSPEHPQPGKHKGFPAITFARTHVTGLSRHFQWVLIGKFSQEFNKTNPALGHSPVKALQKYFEALDLKGSFQICLMENRHLLIQFGLHEDFICMYSYPVWYIKGIPMRIFK